MNFGGAPKSVVIGDGERRVPPFGRRRDEFVGMGGSVEEAEVRVCVKLCVPCHPARLIEHMFAMHGVPESTRIRGWTTN